MKNQKHDDKTTRAYAVLAQLETRYRVRICEHDRTAIDVSGITEKQLSPPYAGGCIAPVCITTRDGSGSSLSLIHISSTFGRLHSRIHTPNLY